MSNNWVCYATVTVTACRNGFDGFSRLFVATIVTDHWFHGMVKHCVQQSTQINCIRLVVRDFLIHIATAMAYITKQQAHYSGMCETCYIYDDGAHEMLLRGNVVKLQ